MNAVRLPSLFESYRSDLGRSRHDLTTPALLLDLPVVRRNIDRMAASLKGPAKLRPHAKTHKCVQLARLQLQAGAVGVTTATVWETAALAGAGIEDILIANQVVGEEKIRLLAQTARTASLTVAVDDLGNAEAISRAALQAGSQVGALIDVDVGMNRCGVRTVKEACALAQHLVRLPGLRLRGVMGYEGHCVLEPNRTVRAGKAGAAVEQLLGIVDALTAAGFEIEVVSAGGTGTYDITGNNPRVTEIQAGSYVFMDGTRLPLAPAFSVGLTVLSTVISHTSGTLVLDCGKKAIGADFTLPRLAGMNLAARACAEEHLLFDVNGNCSLKVGDRVEVIPGYCPGTVNVHEVYHVIEHGVVTDIWPVLTPGTGRGSLRRLEHCGQCPPRPGNASLA